MSLSRFIIIHLYRICKYGTNHKLTNAKCMTRSVRPPEEFIIFKYSVGISNVKVQVREVIHLKKGMMVMSMKVCGFIYYNIFRIYFYYISWYLYEVSIVYYFVVVPRESWLRSARPRVIEKVKDTNTRSYFANKPHTWLGFQSRSLMRRLQSKLVYYVIMSIMASTVVIQTI